MDNTNGELQPIGYLFDTIAVYSPVDITNFIDTLNEPQAFFAIKKAIEMGYNRNLFSLDEAEIISKSLRILSSEYLKNDDRNRQE